MMKMCINKEKMPSFCMGKIWSCSVIFKDRGGRKNTPLEKQDLKCVFTLNLYVLIGLFLAAANQVFLYLFGDSIDASICSSLSFFLFLQE